MGSILNEATPSKHIHILIVGAGLTGLILAQALRKQQEQINPSTKVTFEIFERDAYAFHRGGGWGLTIHWALTDLAKILPEEIMSQFDDCLVNQDAVEQGITGNFLFFNVRSGETVVQWPVPKGIASRVSRERLLRLLMTGLDIQWGKALTDLEFAKNSADGVIAKFADGTQANGNLVVGCDGSRSAVRRYLCPKTYQNDRLPVRLIGLRLDYPITKIRKCLDIDPHVFQGGDPETNVYFWFSFIHMPRAVDNAENASCQIMISWPYVDERSEMPSSNEEKLQLLRTLSKDWTEPFRELVQDIPETTDLRELVLEDWPPVEGRWDNHDGRVTLVGDAAHCMTMFRGEAANHGIIDVRQLVKAVLPEMLSDSEVSDTSPSLDMKDAVSAYEREMIDRTFPAAMNSRQACLDANNFEAISKKSPLATERKRPQVKE